MRTAQLGLRTAMAAFVAFVFLSAPVGAESEISIPFDDLIFSPPGSVVLLAEVEVDSDLVGRTCFLAVVAENQASVHPGNDLIVSTGTSEAVIVGVEDEANGANNQTYKMTVGPTITAQLRIGQDGMSSLGFGLSFDCESPTGVEGPNLGQQQVDRTTTSTTASPASSSTAPPTTTTTTAPPASSSSAPPITAPPASVASNSASSLVASTTSSSSAPATVAGAVTSGSLPETPPARAVTGAPAYTG